MALPPASFVPLSRPVIDQEDIDAAVRVLKSGNVVQGPEVAAFETEFSSLVANRHCVAVNSGTSALQLSLMAVGIGAGDEVIVPSFSFAASANAVRLVGAQPVFADITPDTYVLDPGGARALIGPRTAAIMPVHLYGLPADMHAIGTLASQHGLAIVEDAAQAHGALVGQTPVGALGTTGCFSFYPTKNMHCLEGGMITTADAGLARTLRLLRNQGMEQRYANEIVGGNMRLTDVAAAIGRQQFQRLERWNSRRRSNAATLRNSITGVALPPEPPGYRHVYHQFTIRVQDNRDDLQAHLTTRNVESKVYYPTPIHRLEPYLTEAGRPDARWELPETDRAAAEVLSLPVHPCLSDDDLQRVIEAVNDWPGHDA
jgi:perosamine synthetase